MRVGDPCGHLNIEGSQEPLVPAGGRVYTYVPIRIDLFGRPIDTKPLFEECLDSPLSVMCLVDGNTRVSLVSPQVTTRATS